MQLNLLKLYTLNLYKSPVRHTLTKARGISKKMLQNIIACFQELHLSFVRFDLSVLLLSAFAYGY
jgi:hypothetical protein